MKKPEKPAKNHPWRAWQPGWLSDDRARQHSALPGNNWTPIRKPQ